MPDCGHLSTLEQPEAVNRALVGMDGGVDGYRCIMTSVLDLIGETPLIEVTRIDRGPCRLFLKLESANPSGSLKDRPARTMIEAAEADGRLKPGGTIVEATAGNTGLGLALVGGRKGYRTVLVVPDKMAREKVLHAKAMGAEVVITRSDVGKGHPDYYQDLAEAITRRTPGAFFVNQFDNPANPRAHETTTGPEILRQMEGDVDAIVVGVGSGGTLTGIGRFMRQASPQTADDPGRSGRLDAGALCRDRPDDGGGKLGGRRHRRGFRAAECRSLAGRARPTRSPIAESFAAARDLLRAEGILAGSSSGTLLAAALRYCRAQTRAEARGDPGLRFRRQISVQGVQPDASWRRKAGPIRIATAPCATSSSAATARAPPIVVRPQDNLRTVFARMRSADVSQLPVIDERGQRGRPGRRERRARRAADRAGRRQQGVRRGRSKDVMVTRLETISADAPIADLVPLFRKDYVAIVMDGDHFLGVATRLDLINYFRITRTRSWPRCAGPRLRE